ncbi:RHS repeat domain-containing protein [Flavobacterium sp. CS20]|uniref:RHS repeat domain-containing protein n=1 Tax=Flavobacterium sp. CS20 TaxID=2775246 RepID=UPI001B39DE28|nr:RHS repeat-associated core domain-containing protein [Flavobacterium sp. CS20]QTY26816.1 hypothetical protein IGB25_13215 [Flavobacterium sp. CS20]
MEIHEIKSQLTLAQVLHYYHLKPDKHLRLNCPFHEDKTPSFQVYYKTQTAYCFSSNGKTHSKSFIDFIMYKENQSKEDKKVLQKILQNQTFAEPEENSEASAIFYYHADHLGSNEIISDNTGAPHEFHLTLPFGETMAEQRKPVADYYNSWKFTGKELDEETGLYYFGARYYQPSWSVWLSVDPKAEDAPGWSPYRAFFCNPINYTDPTGLLENPIYDNETSEFLGTDDKGLQGEAIIMDKEDFTQGMSHKEAEEKGKYYHQLDKVEQFRFMESGYGHWQGLKYRPDYDGVVTFDEALDWYHTGEGQPLYVDVSKIDLKSSKLSVDDFDGISLSVNFFNIVNTHPFNSNILYRPAVDNNLSHVYGTLGMTLLNPNTGTIRLNTYARYNGGIDRFDFNISLFKYIADKSRENGNPTPFNFMGYGLGTIHTTP